MNKVTIATANKFPDFSKLEPFLSTKSVYFPGKYPFRKPLFDFYGADLIVIVLTRKRDIPNFKALITEESIDLQRIGPRRTKRIMRPEILCITNILKKGDILERRWLEWIDIEWVPSYYAVTSVDEENLINKQETIQKIKSIN